jgi:hypothetical protein
VKQVAAYVSGRIQTAGGVAGQVFTREAVMAIHEYSGGIPRVINVICDNAMLAGFAVGRRPVTAVTIEEVCREFGIGRRSSSEGSLEIPRPRPLAEIEGPAVLATGADDGVRQRERQGGGLFEGYVAAGKRRFSFF